MIISPSFSRFFSTGPNQDSHRDVVEKEFYQSLRLRNGSFKTTYANRFDDLNLIVLNYIQTFAQPVHLMDVAVSSGTTTWDWCKQLDASNVSYQMMAGDLTAEGIVVAWSSWFKVLTDDSGHPLQFEIGNMGIRGWLQRREILMLFFIPWFAIRMIAKTVIRVSRSSKRLSKLFNISSRHVWLVTPKLKDHLSVQVRKDDIFVIDPSLTQRFHAIRVANILNLQYFNTEEIKRALNVIKMRLRNDGLLIVCRTFESGENHGSLFRWNGRMFTLVERIGDGSEIEDIVLDKLS